MAPLANPAPRAGLRPAPAIVLGLALAAAKGCALRPRPPSARGAGNRHTTHERNH